MRSIFHQEQKKSSRIKKFTTLSWSNAQEGIPEITELHLTDTGRRLTFEMSETSPTKADKLLSEFDKIEPGAKRKPRQHSNETGPEGREHFQPPTKNFKYRRKELCYKVTNF